MIAIIDYDMGNVGSIKNMLSRIGIESVITSKVKDLIVADRIILPGVGAFDMAMDKLSTMELFPVLNELVLQKKKPILGICLGMQIMAKTSEEGKVMGLEWIDAKVIKFKLKPNKLNLKIPHMGWNEIKQLKPSKLINNIHVNPRFYFVHSYHIVPKIENQILTTTEYGEDFVSGIEKNNIFGVQFHPEKSHKYGMQLLDNFSNI